MTPKKAPARRRATRPARAVRGAPGRAPRLVLEAELHGAGWVALAAADEVGRGALSGPVTVGVVIVTPGIARPPRGLRDSKLLTAAARTALVPRIERWVPAFAVAHASSVEIDRIGIIAALRLAGRRAIAGLGQPVDGVLLDGNHDYLSDPAQLELADPLSLVEDVPTIEPWPPVRTAIKADLRCASVAAASVLAKTTRDAIMVRLAEEHPEYGWHENKGYASLQHRAALLEHGPTPYHRVSWRLGLSADAPTEADLEADLEVVAAGEDE